MWNAKPGMQVVCIKEFDNSLVSKNTFKILPAVNQILTIRKVFSKESVTGSDLLGDASCFLVFHEIQNPKIPYEGKYHEACFNSDLFRPVKKTDISSLIAIAQNPKKSIKGPKDIKRKKLVDA